MKEPLPIPEGMTKEKMEAIPVAIANGWRKSDDFVHKCGKKALLHPYTNSIWGCERCNFFTYSPSFFFKPTNRKVMGRHIN